MSPFYIMVFLTTGGFFLHALAGGGYCPLPIGLWGMSWMGAALGVGALVKRAHRKAFACFSAAGLFALAGILLSPTPFRIFWVLCLLGLLFYVWPLRFLALGEITLAFLFSLPFWTGMTYWSGAMQAMNPPQTAAFYGFCLFLTLFFINVNLYAEHKSLQQYSLPVLLGRIFPVLDRRWLRPAPRSRLLAPWVGPALLTTFFLLTFCVS